MINNGKEGFRNESLFFIINLYNNFFTIIFVSVLIKTNKMTFKQINQRIKEIESKNFNASNEEIHELINLRAELTVKTLWDFK